MPSKTLTQRCHDTQSFATKTIYLLSDKQQIAEGISISAWFKEVTAGGYSTEHVFDGNHVNVKEIIAEIVIKIQKNKITNMGNKIIYISIFISFSLLLSPNPMDMELASNQAVNQILFPNHIRVDQAFVVQSLRN